MSLRMLCQETVVCAAPDQTSCELAGEVVILALDSGIYFGLDAVGARVWSLIQQPAEVGEIVVQLCAEYDVDQAQCEADVLRLLEEMQSRGLVTIEGGD